MKYFKTWFIFLLVLNIALRLVIYYNTILFAIGDFKVHLNAMGRIAAGDHVPLSQGNFLFAISYIGYFFKYYLGNADYFFWFLIIAGTAASAILSLLVHKITNNPKASIITLVILSFYTEFMTFSSVFYTVVIMIFLLSIMIFFLFRYYDSAKISASAVSGIILACIASFFFKQELIFLPIFLAVPAILLKKDKLYLRKTIVLSVLLGIATISFYKSGIVTKNENDVLANDFVFFGHTDYGGDMGEGSFIYPENRARYDSALEQYCRENNIESPDRRDINKFQSKEILRFITQHPFKWVALQATKFFRTYGVVPESTSFKILYTGLLRGNLWLTAFVVTVPVAIIILLFIIFFNLEPMRRIFKTSDFQQFLSRHNIESKIKEPITTFNNRRHFVYVYCTLFIYYLIATTFFGQYQERYRMPVMVVFIIPLLGVFLASFDKKQFFNRISLTIKSAIVALFLIIWILQVGNALTRKERLNNAIESAGKDKSIDPFDK